VTDDVYRPEAETEAPVPKPAHVVRLPGFLRDEPVGLGTVIKRTTTALGVKPCGGCAKRAERLDRFIGFSGRQR
jgi:hypothetical protein